ncbi:MAG TPA: threonine--tRNA ligase [Candidatus Paceibacterota bacterium]|nr:threonine--tRNA ligase [Candidatus Paceibacterota bacterium]
MQNIEAKRHTLAHLLAAVVLEKYPHAKPTIGPAIDDGFYYDFDFSGGEKPTEKELLKLESAMRKLLPHWKEMTGDKVAEVQAKERFAGNPFKLELIDEISKKGEQITLYTAGKFTDLCRGGHSDSPSRDIAADSFTIDRIAGAYWRGDEKNPQLTRIYGLAFDTKEELDAYKTQREEARKRDHKKLGPELDLFFIDEKVGKGLPMWTPKGTTIKFELENFTRALERKYGYEHVSTPYLGAEELYRTSGHLDHYAHNMYAPIDMDGDKFYLRPMACPHHIRMFQRKPWSYRDLPVRYAEIADYNRYEKSGELMGMIRVRKFQLTDAHLFVTPEGLKEEFKRVCQMIIEGMRGLGLADIVTYRFSKRDPENKEKYYPDDNLWNHAEGLMKEALDELGISYVEAKDEAAFYGPKLDVQARNVNGKEDTLFTAQMDFLLPQKFEIEYTDIDGSKKRPVMIHRSTIGCLERTFAFLIEHFAGAFPTWLSPVQVKILSVSEKHVAYANEVAGQLKEAGVRVEIDDANESLGKKIRNGKTEKVPYLLVLGDMEVEAKTVTAESRDHGKQEAVPVAEFVKQISEEIRTRA